MIKEIHSRTHTHTHVMGAIHTKSFYFDFTTRIQTQSKKRTQTNTHFDNGYLNESGYNYGCCCFRFVGIECRALYDDGSILYTNATLGHRAIYNVRRTMQHGHK